MRSWLRNFVFICVVISVMMLVALVAAHWIRESAYKRSVRYYQHEQLQEPDAGSYVENTLNTRFPIVSIETGGRRIPGTTVTDANGATIGYESAEDGSSYIRAHIRIIDRRGEYNHLEDSPDIDSQIRIRVRGNSSRLFDKQSYKIMLETDDGLERKLDVMGMGAHDEWALYGPFLDKTLLRNYIYMNLYGELDSFTPDVRYCEVYLDGAYRGLYMMMELIGIGKTRVNIAPTDSRKDKTSYIVRLDKENRDMFEVKTFSYYTYNVEPKSAIEVIYPGRLGLTEAYKDYINADISQFEKALYSYDFNDKSKGYRAYIDVQSFVNYYIFSEFLAINDMCSRSTYLYKDLGGKICIGPGWDFNNAAANNFILDIAGSDGTGFNYIERTWFKMLLKDEFFVGEVIKSYRKMRNGGILDNARLNRLIDDTAAFLSDAIPRNYEVWGYAFNPADLDNLNKLRPNERNPRSYEEALRQLKDFMTVRGEWMDANIDSLRQYCDHARIKQYLD